MSFLDEPNEWTRGQLASWRHLATASIARWTGIDENVGGGEELVFLDSSDQFRQLERLRVELESGAWLDVGTYANDEACGLSLHPSDREPFDLATWNRDSDLSDLPTGRIQHLELHFDAREGFDGDLIEAELTIDDRKVLFVAAEVMPTWTGADIGWAEECVFVFTDPAVADAINWKASRRYTAVSISA